MGKKSGAAPAKESTKGKTAIQHDRVIARERKNHGVLPRVGTVGGGTGGKNGLP